MPGTNWGHAFYQAAIERAIEGSGDSAGRGFHQHTIGDFTRAVMAIASDQDARLFYDGYLRYLDLLPAEKRSQRYTPEEVAKGNIGWCFGEGMAPERIAMWVKACGAAHPVFGTFDPPPTPEEAFAAGLRAGQAGAS